MSEEHNNMKTYTVDVAVTVEAYGRLKVQARGPKDAERRVNRMIEKGEVLDCVFEPEWDTADDVRVVSAEAE